MKKVVFSGVMQFMLKPPLILKMHTREIKQLFPDSDHILMAYKLRNYSGHHDDGEFGASSKLEQMLLSSAKENLVVFVSRVYGGIQLGQCRHVLIEKVAREAMFMLQ